MAITFFGRDLRRGRVNRDKHLVASVGGYLDAVPSLAARHAAGFAEVERGLVEEVARRTGLDAGRDAYPALVVAASLGAIRVALSIWQERDWPGPLRFKPIVEQAARGELAPTAPALIENPDLVIAIRPEHR